MKVRKYGIFDTNVRIWNWKCVIIFCDELFIEVLVGTPMGGVDGNLLVPPGGVDENLLAPPRGSN